MLMLMEKQETFNEGVTIDEGLPYAGRAEEMKKVIPRNSGLNYCAIFSVSITLSSS